MCNIEHEKVKSKFDSSDDVKNIFPDDSDGLNMRPEDAEKGVANAFLGNIGGLRATLSLNDPQKVSFSSPFLKIKKSLFSDLKDSFELLHFNQNFLLKKNVIDMKSGLFNCRRSPVKNHVVFGHEWGKAKGVIRNLSTCGLVWSCPVCANQIAHLRAAEASVASSLHLGKSPLNSLLMLTLTMPHKKTDSLKFLLNAYSQACESFYRHRTYKSVCASIASLGRISALEITAGDSSSSGWHVHGHMMYFCEPSFTFDDDFLAFQQKKLAVLWVDCLLKNGIKMSLKTKSEALRHSVNLKKMSSADYVTKIYEISSSHTKKGRKNGRYTPFELLRLAHDGEKWAGDLWSEYVVCTKGKKLLRWSRGLKDLFGITEWSDLQIAEYKNSADIENLFAIASKDYLFLCSHVEDFKSYVLYHISIGKVDFIKELLSSLHCQFVDDPDVLSFLCGDEYDTGYKKLPVQVELPFSADADLVPE